MHEIEFLNGIFSWNEKPMEYEGFELIDELSLHLKLSGSYYCFIILETKINGKTCNSVEEFLTILN